MNERLGERLRVILPAVVPGLVTGFAMAFARALGEYGSVIFVSSNLPGKSAIGISGAQWAILRTLHDIEIAGEPSVRLSELGNRLRAVEEEDS